jgi:hypothetical protein
MRPRLSTGKTPPEVLAHGHDSLERHITATDTNIERLVYDLYDLTDEEIKIVEDAAK